MEAYTYGLKRGSVHSLVPVLFLNPDKVSLFIEELASEMKTYLTKEYGISGKSISVKLQSLEQNDRVVVVQTLLSAVSDKRKLSALLTWSFLAPCGDRNEYRFSLSVDLIANRSHAFSSDLFVFPDGTALPLFSTKKNAYGSLLMLHFRMVLDQVYSCALSLIDLDKEDLFSLWFNRAHKEKIKNEAGEQECALQGKDLGMYFTTYYSTLLPGIKQVHDLVVEAVLYYNHFYQQEHAAIDLDEKQEWQDMRSRAERCDQEILSQYPTVMPLSKMTKALWKSLQRNGTKIFEKKNLQRAGGHNNLFVNKAGRVPLYRLFL